MGTLLAIVLAASLTTRHDHRLGVTFAPPRDWHQAQRSLTPSLADATQVLAVATFPLRTAPPRLRARRRAELARVFDSLDVRR